MSGRKKKKGTAVTTTDDAMLASLLERLKNDAGFRTQLRRAMGAATAADRAALRPDPAATLLARVGGLPTRGEAVERGGDPAKGEGTERAVEVYDLGEDHSSGKRFEVRVVHPEWALHPYNSVPRSRQAPEIARFDRKADAHAMAHAYSLALGSEPTTAAKAFPGAHVPVTDETGASSPVSLHASEE